MKKDNPTKKILINVPNTYFSQVVFHPKKKNIFYYDYFSSIGVFDLRTNKTIH